MIPEREQEALMRLTMCAREECIMCKYHKECDFDFQYKLSTESMNILAEALRKTEPTISKMEQVDKDINVRSKDEPQTERYCTNCKHNGVIEDYECRECHGMDKHEFIKPQTERSE